MIKDWRNYKQHSTWRTKGRVVSILTPNAENNLLRYYWGCSFGTGGGPDHWSRFISKLFSWRDSVDPGLHIDIDSMSLLEDCGPGEARLLLDAWSDSWKWGRARTIYHGSLAYMAQVAIASGLVSESDPAGLGNWASGETYELLGSAGDVARGVSLEAPLLLYHGTTTNRWEEIQRDGFSLSRLGGVYLSGSSMRAGYYATDRTRLERKKLGKAQRDNVQPVVLQVELWPPVFSSLRADEDWLKLHQYETGTTPADSAWQESLAEFGQVKLVETLPADAVTDVTFLPHE